MHQQLSAWEEAGFHFSLDWLLRNVNAVVTGRAEFSALANEPVEAIQDGLARASRAVDMSLNLIGSRLGLDHNRVLGARAALPLISRYLSDRRFSLRDSAEADGLLYWYVNAFLWGRYAGSTETVLNQDLEAIRESSEDPVRALIGALEASRGDLRIRPNDFVGWSRGARFYPLLYLLTRVQHARDWGSGIELRQSLLGARASLELHHVFPKAQLYRHGYSRQEVNALANFTFLTMETNREISDRDPAEYLPEFASRHPGAVDSHWVPMDRELWSVERYLDFLEARRELLARAANEFLDELRGGLGDPIDLEDGRPVAASVESEELGDEEREIRDARRWVIERGLAAGEIDFELVDEKTGELRATLDLAWPDGVQPGLTQPLALLLDEGAEVEEVAGRHGFRFFTSSDSLKSFILDEVLEEGQAA